MTAAAFSSFFFFYPQSWLDFMRLCSFCRGVFSQGRTVLLLPRTLVSKQDNGEKSPLIFTHSCVWAGRLSDASGQQKWGFTDKDWRWLEVVSARCDGNAKWCEMCLRSDSSGQWLQVNASWLGLFICRELQCKNIGRIHPQIFISGPNYFPGCLKILNCRLVAVRGQLVTQPR